MGYFLVKILVPALVFLAISVVAIIAIANSH